MNVEEVPLLNRLTVRIAESPETPPSDSAPNEYLRMGCLITPDMVVTASLPREFDDPKRQFKVTLGPADEPSEGFRARLRARDKKLGFDVLEIIDGKPHLLPPELIPPNSFSEEIPSTESTWTSPSAGTGTFVTGTVYGVRVLKSRRDILLKVDENPGWVFGSPVLVGERVVALITGTTVKEDVGLFVAALPIADMIKSEVTSVVRDAVAKNIAAASGDAAPADEARIPKEISAHMSTGSHMVMNFTAYVCAALGAKAISLSVLTHCLLHRGGRLGRRLLESAGIGPDDVSKIFLPDEGEHFSQDDDALKKYMSASSGSLDVGGMTVGKAFGQVLNTRGEYAEHAEYPPLSENLLKALEYAYELARQSPNGTIKGWHLLYGALSVEDYYIIKRLNARGITKEYVLRVATHGGPESEPPERTITGISSDEPRGRDLLGVKRDVWALSSLLAAKKLEPPVSVGLFGDWGSGKSFFMQKMEERIKSLSKSEPPNPSYCSNIVQLKFNAWHYIDTENLWASLTSSIFDGLAHTLAEDEGVGATEYARARLLAATGGAEAALAEAERNKSQADAELRESERRLEELERNAATLRPREVVREAYRAVAANPVVSGKLEEAGAALGIPEARAAALDVKEQLATLGEGYATLRALRLALGAKNFLLWLIAVASIAAGAGVCFLLIPRLIDGGAPELVARATALLAGLGAALGPFVIKARDAVGIIKGVKENIDNIKAKKQAEAEEKRKTLKDARGSVQQRVVEAAERAALAKEELAKLQRQLKELSADKLMNDFIRVRSESSDYTKHLGVIAQAHKDFRQLSELLAEVRRQAERGGGAAGAGKLLPRVDRIILYIDDLDRCPEDKVVEVLQAVRLLLAFPLFVVVIGVDSRWLMRSLKQHMRGFQEEGDHVLGITTEEERAHWQSTPANYVEKIIQIPFTLRPMRRLGFGKLVEALAAGNADEEDEKKGEAAVEKEEAGKKGENERQVSLTEKEKQEVKTDAAADTSRTQRAQTIVGGTRQTVGTITADAGSPRADVAGGNGAGGNGAGLGARDDAKGAEGSSDSSTGDGGKASGESSTGDAASEEKKKETERKEEATGVPDRHLVITRAELVYMKTLHRLIPSPRAAKRFVNLYRLLRAGVDDDKLEAFERDAPDGEHRAVLLLLAVLTGYPDESVEIFRDLLGRPDEDSWWDFVAGYGPRGEATPETGDAQAAAQAARWRQLHETLEEIRPVPHDPVTCAPFKRWALDVARFSFQAGRVLANSREEEAEDD